MNLKEIVKKHLEDNGYDGLFNDAIGNPGCGCGLDDFMPCDEPGIECEPAYKNKCKGCGKALFWNKKEDVEECELCLD